MTMKTMMTGMKMRRTMMTKAATIFIGILLIAFIAAAIIGTGAIKESTETKITEQKVLLARKEEMLLEEQRLEQLINSLNLTLEQEKAKQELLLSQLSDSETAKHLKEQQAALAAQQTVTVPVPAPKPVVKTRAS